MVLRKVIDYAIRTTGAALIPRAYKAFRKYDVATTNRLFGKSGGKGFRHGRDVGLLVSDYLKGDGLDPSPFQPEYSSRSKPQARRRYSKYGRPCRCNNYRSSNSRQRRSRTKFSY